MQVVGTRHPGRSSSYLLGEPAGLIFSQVFSLISSACFLKEENKYAAEGIGGGCGKTQDRFAMG